MFALVGVVILIIVNINKNRENKMVIKNYVEVTEEVNSYLPKETDSFYLYDNFEVNTESCASEDIFNNSINNNYENNIVKNNFVRITEKEINPYSSETTVGFYLYDIFEANRGSFTNKNKFTNEVFNYYKIFNPLQDDNYNMEWSINLIKLEGSTPLANKFNDFHKLLFEIKKEEMITMYEEGVMKYERGMNPDFSYYSRNLRTEAYYCWSSFFTVVDVENVHMSQKGGCSVITGNFNISLGKQYKLNELFIIENYKKWLLTKIESQYKEQNYLINDWEDVLNQEDIRFLMCFKGLMLIDNFSQRTFLIEWDELEDILSEEIANVVKNR